MKSNLAVAVAAVTLLAAAPSWAQSLTPIQGWVPLNSPKAKALERADIAMLAPQTGIDGIVIANTTIARPPGLRSGHAGEAGGLSGKPLFAPSTALLADIYRLTGGAVPLIGVGGIAGAADAYAKIRAGASLVQLYTALVFHGPALVGRIKRGLAEFLRRDGFSSISEAVGADHAPARTPLSTPAA